MLFYLGFSFQLLVLLKVGLVGRAKQCVTFSYESLFIFLSPIRASAQCISVVPQHGQVINVCPQCLILMSIAFQSS